MVILASPVRLIGQLGIGAAGYFWLYGERLVGFPGSCLVPDTCMGGLVPTVCAGIHIHIAPTFWEVCAWLRLGLLALLLEVLNFFVSRIGWCFGLH